MDALCNLGPNKTCGIDNISPIVLKKIVFIPLYLFTIFSLPVLTVALYLEDM